MGLLIFLFPFLEVAFFFYLSDYLGFLNTAILVLMGSVLGFFILSRLGRAFLLEMHQGMQSGKNLEVALLRRAALFMSGLLFLFPGLLSDAVACFFLIVSLFPRLLSPLVKSTWSRVSKNGNVFVFRSGPSPFGQDPFMDGGPFSSQPSGMRDVTPDSEGHLNQSGEIIDLLPDSKDDQS